MSKSQVFDIQKRALHRAQYRGTRECDLIFKNFISQQGAWIQSCWSLDEWSLFDQFLSENETDLIDWLLNNHTPPQQYRLLIHQMRSKFYPNLHLNDFLEIARGFAAYIENNKIQKGPIAFYGDLGVGKSTFIRQTIQFLLKNPDLVVPSPTFTLYQTYEANSFEIMHFDLYRLDHLEDIMNLGFLESIYDQLCLIEWPEKIEHLLPKETIFIKITMDQGQEEDQRRAIHFFIPAHYPKF